MKERLNLLINRVQNDDDDSHFAMKLLQYSSARNKKKNMMKTIEERERERECEREGEREKMRSNKICKLRIIKIN
jgi:hypothetical protein